MKKIKRIEVKRAFVLSQRFTSKRMRTKSVRKNMIAPSEENFRKHLVREKKKVLAMSEQSLDRIIADENKNRLSAYDELQWYVDEISVGEVRMWTRAGGLYDAWTKRVTLQTTAKKVKNELAKETSPLRRVRAIQVVPQIMAVTSILKKEKYLVPIIVPNGIYKKRKGRNRKIQWLIDDGCMRSLTYAVSGDKKIKSFIGKYPDKNI